MVMEAMCDMDLYCWHFFVCRTGTNNDITVAKTSPIFLDTLGSTRRIKLLDWYVVYDALIWKQTPTDNVRVL